jgi:plastocyanin
MSTTTPVVNGVAQLNEMLSLLVPAQPTAFPGSQSLTIGTQAVILVPQASQTLNGNPSTIQVAAGTTVRFTSSSSFASSTLTGLGPGNAGTLTVTRDTSTAATRALSAGNGTSTANNTSVLLTSIADYGTPTGFWKTFNSQVTGTSLVTGWHTITLAHSSAGSTTATFYNDLNTITAPVVTPTSLTIASTGTPNWSSGIPHYSGATISLVCAITNIAKDTRLIGTATFISHNGVSIFGSSTQNYTYSDASITPTQNMTASTSVTIPINFNPSTSFGIDSTVPSVSATNVFATGTAVSISSIFSKSIPWKTLSTGTGLDELALTSNLGSTSNTRIGLNVASATPAWSGLVTTWNPTVAAATNEAKVIGGVIKQDANNYTNTTFYQLPTLTGVSSYIGHAATQYFTFKFSKAGLSKFQIKLTSSTGVSGIKIALPGSALTSSLNNWIDLGINYAGAGVPGSNGSNGCNDASVTNVSTTPFTSARTLQSYQCTFGTQSTTNSTANEVYVRIELAAGESISYLSLEPGV